MKIKEFAELCSCRPKTLRFYDEKGLLKPARVDEASGYRFYDEAQALDFVKIKNLQRAGFKLDHIKQLLSMDEREVRAAFDRKIEEIEAQLSEIQSIRDSYRNEMEEILERIEKSRRGGIKKLREFDAAQELGIDEGRYEQVIDEFNRFVDEIVIPTSCDYEHLVEVDEDTATTESIFALIDNPRYEHVFEAHGWERAAEFVEGIPALEANGVYVMPIALSKEKLEHAMAFLNTMHSLVAGANAGKGIDLTGCADGAKDGANHFWLLKRLRRPE